MRRGCGRLHPGGALRGPGAAVRPGGGGEEEEEDGDGGMPRFLPARPRSPAAPTALCPASPPQLPAFPQGGSDLSRPSWSPSGQPGLPPSLGGSRSLPPGGPGAPVPQGRPESRLPQGVPEPPGLDVLPQPLLRAVPAGLLSISGRCLRAGGCSVPAEHGPEQGTGTERAAAPGGARPAGRPHRRGHQWGAGEPHEERPGSRAEPPGAALRH